jgi:hypothetical protein
MQVQNTIKHGVRPEWKTRMEEPEWKTRMEDPNGSRPEWKSDPNGRTRMEENTIKHGVRPRLSRNTPGQTPPDNVYGI